VNINIGTVVASLAQAGFSMCEPAHPRPSRNHVPDKGGFEVLRCHEQRGEDFEGADFVAVYRRIADSEVNRQNSRGDIRREALAAYAEVLRGRGMHAKVWGKRLLVSLPEEDS
jgi:hypothetical protein